MLTLPFGASADVAAGFTALARGDFDGAVAEWTEPAGRGDPEAEFGLGKVYEQGRNDYRRAEYWYSKAAEHGSSQAKYRLALIAMAGNKESPPDTIKAYKWAVIAAAANDEWGKLAADLLQLLKAHLPAAEQQTGTEQAAAGEKGSRATTGPALTSATDELNEAIRHIDCASLRSSSSEGVTVISGTVTDEEEHAKLVEIANRLAAGGHADLQIAIMPPPLCRSLAEFDSMRSDGLVSEQGLEARLAGGATRLREGDPIRVEIKSPSYTVNLRIDYFSLNGQVLHMWPNPDEPHVTLAPGAKRVFGDLGGKAWNAGGAPFGAEFITVTATRQPLDLATSRPDTEAGSEYLRDLESALRRARSASGQPNLLATVIVQTGAR